MGSLFVKGKVSQEPGEVAVFTFPLTPAIQTLQEAESAPGGLWGGVGNFKP